MAELKNVPNFRFEQCTLETLEAPITVHYYNGNIELEQNGNEILITTELSKKLFREIEKHKEEAQELLECRK